MPERAPAGCGTCVRAVSDIRYLKPAPIKRLDARIKNGFGVMLTMWSRLFNPPSDCIYWDLARIEDEGDVRAMNTPRRAIERLRRISDAV